MAPLLQLIAAPFPKIYWRASYSGMKRAHSPARTFSVKEKLKQRTAELYSWTKLAKCPLPFR